jgi:DnaJ family protein C protein 28
MVGKDRSVDAIIKQAMKEGKFDDLEGKGKPLNLFDSPYVDEGWRMAYNMLSSQGLTLPWIDKRNTIEGEYLKAIEKLAGTMKWYLEKNEAGEDLVLAEEEWGKAKLRFIGTSKELNEVIDSYNLEIPTPRFYRKRINPETEIAALEK